MGRTSSLEILRIVVGVDADARIRYCRALLSLSSPISVRDAAHFFPVENDIIGPLDLGRRPQAASMPSHTATATQAVKSVTSAGGSWGRSRADTQAPALGDWKVRPSRPRRRSAPH